MYFCETTVWSILFIDLFFLLDTLRNFVLLKLLTIRQISKKILLGKILFHLYIRLSYLRASESNTLGTRLFNVCIRKTTVRNFIYQSFYWIHLEFRFVEQNLLKLL